MRYAMFATCSAFAVASAVTLSAQTPAAPRPGAPQPSAATPARTDDRSITVTGCLKAWEPKTENTPGAPNRANTAIAAGTDKFLLANVEGEGSGTPGATTTPGLKQYMVMGDNGVNLGPHLNHKVRITGTVDAKPPVPPAPAPTTAEAQAQKDTATPGAAPAHPKDEDAISSLTASSVTMVSDTCPSASR